MKWKPPQKAKRDANEPQVIHALRSYGLFVHAIDLPVDTLVWFRDQTYLVEIKNGPKAKLTTAQEKFVSAWPGEVVILNSVDAAIDWAESLRYSKHSKLAMAGKAQ